MSIWLAILIIVGTLQSPQAATPSAMREQLEPCGDARQRDGPTCVNEGRLP